MTDRGILFSAPMIRALMEGRKTQTRRLLYRKTNGPRCIKLWDHPTPEGELWTASGWQKVQPGDRLWVKENHRLTDCPCTEACRGAGHVYYDADNSGYDNVRLNKLRPSIHMPRWASRLTLIVTATKIERLLDISDADAFAEGVEYETADPGFWYVPGIYPHSLTAVGIEERGAHAAQSYLKLWDHLHGHMAHVANPEVVALTFTVHKQNIDAMKEPA